MEKIPLQAADREALLASLREMMETGQPQMERLRQVLHLVSRGNLSHLLAELNSLPLVAMPELVLEEVLGVKEEVEDEVVMPLVSFFFTNRSLNPVLWIRIRMDPHSIWPLDPDPHSVCGSGSRGVKIG